MSVSNELVPRKIFTVGSFLSNPTGDIGSASMGRKHAFEAAHKEYKQLLSDGKKFSFGYFRVGNDIILKVKVPSSTFDDFHYDVLFKFENPGEEIPRHLDPLTISFFSNAPSFNFSYAYVFNFFHNLIPETTKLFDKKAINEYPKERNPDMVTFYEKSITQALLYIVDNKLMDTATTIFRNSVVKTTMGKVLATVTTVQNKLDEYKKLTKIASERKKKEKFERSVNRLDETTKKRVTRRRKPDSGGKYEAPKTAKVKMQIDQSKKRKLDMKVDNKISNKVSMKVSDRKVDSTVNMKVK